jgi:hypothetical protein
LITFLLLSPQVSAQKSPLTPFARSIQAWGQRFSTHLPEGWRIEWKPSQLPDIGWFAMPTEGYQIRFVHETRKVFIPVPSADGRPPTMAWHPHQCSLHFYPKKGYYQAHASSFSLPPPARLYAVISEALIFLPDRFSTREYPCPLILERFQKRYAKELRLLSSSSLNALRAKLPMLSRIEKRLYYTSFFFNTKPIWSSPQWRAWMRRSRIRTLFLLVEKEKIRTFSIENI